MMKQLGEEWSRKGFIYFSVEYRRGRSKDQDGSKTSVQQQMASYRAIQDGCGAIRSIIKKNRDGAFSPFFKIDETQFFVGGASAGGVVAMGCAYYRTSVDLITDQSMIDDAFKKATGSTYNIKQVLGKMHSDYYYAPVDAQYWPIIKGVICMWSGIAIPYSFDGGNDKGASEKDFFKTTTEPWANPPMIAFHGDDDIVFPFYDNSAQNLNLSPIPGFAENNYNSENLCTIQNRTFTQYIDPTPGPPDIPELKMCSTLNMFYILKKLNRCTELYLDCDMGHGLDKNCGGCAGDENNLTKDKDCDPCIFDSNFGTNSVNTEQVITYMAQRIAVFFHAIMNYSGSNHPPYNYTNRPFFKECENYRTCGEGNNNNCSTPINDILCDGTAIILE